MTKTIFDLKAMRCFVSGLILCAVFLSCPGLKAANDTHTPINYTATNVELWEAVQAIADRTGLKFNSTTSQANIASSYYSEISSLTITNSTWSQALETILATQNDDGLTPLTYRIVNSQIVLYYQSAYPTTAALVMNFFPRDDGSTSPVSGAITTVINRTVTTDNWKSITATPIAGYHFVKWTGSSTVRFANNFSSSTKVKIPDVTNPLDETEKWNADSTVIAWFEEDDITNGLVAYYPFNGDASDDSGNGNNGTVNGATLVPDRFGNANRAYAFDGVNDYIDCGNDASLDLTTFSISCWVNSDHAPATGLSSYIIGKDSNYASFWDPKPGITFSSGGTPYSSISTSTFTADKWFHIAATYNQNTLTVYVNGSSSFTISADKVPQTSTNPLCIGASSMLSDFFTGSIDDVRIYSRTLAPSEVTKLYKLTTSKITTSSSPAAGGYVTPSPSITVNTGDIIPIAAYPNAGYRFSKWTVSGIASLDDPSYQVCDLTVGGSSTLTASFVVDSTHNLVSLSNPYPVAPTTSISLQNSMIQILKQVGLTYDSATSNPNIGSMGSQLITPDIHNLLWTDALTIILDPLGLTYKMENSKVVLYQQSAYSGQATLSMNFTPTGGGATSPTSGPISTTVDIGEFNPIQAFPCKNYHFLNWTGSAGVTITDTGNPSTTASIIQDSTVVANFAHDTATLTMAAVNGSTTPAIGDWPGLNTATAIPIVATPAANYHFVNWTVTSGSATITNATSASTTIKLNGGDLSAATITANFAHDTATLTMAKNGNGTINPIAGIYTNQITAIPIPITATPSTGYHVNWTVTGSATVAAPASNDTTLTLTGANNSKATVTANFIIDNYPVVFNTNGFGTVNGIPSVTQNINYGSDCAPVTAEPNADYRFIEWTGDGGPYTANPLTITNVPEPMTITATFAHNQGSIIADFTGTGDVSIDAGPYDTKTEYNISAVDTDPANFEFINWTSRGDVFIAEPTAATTTVRLTGQDGCSGIATANFFNFTSNILASGTGATMPLSAWRSCTVYRINVTAMTTKLVVTTSDSSTGDCDLYVRPAKIPSIEEYYAKSTNSGTTGESITVKNPVEGDWYIMAYGYYGPAGYSGVTVTATISSDLPGVPELLAAESQADHVALTWNPGANATSYDIYRSRTNSFEMAALLPAGAGVASSPFSDMTALVGTSYYYWVVSRNGAAASAPSNWLSGSLDELLPTPLKNGIAVTGRSGLEGTTLKYQITTPSSPAQALLEIKASIGTGDCDLTVTDSGGVVKYGVKITNNETVRIENPPANEVYTINLYANSAFSGLTLMAKFYAAIPVAPAGLAASDGTYPGAVLVSWKESAGATVYEVWRAESVVGGVVPKSIDAEKLSEISDISFFDNINVSNGNIYYYWIKAKNPAGTSAFSASNSGYVSKVPAAPSSFTASDGTYFEKIRLSWPKVAGATSYLLYRDTSSTKPTDPFIEIAYDSTKTTYTYDDMGGANPSPNLSNLKYYYWVVAKNANGSSPAKTDSGSLSTKVPTAVTATKGTFFGQVKVTWTAVGGAASYNIYRSQDPAVPGSVFGTSTTATYYDASVIGVQEYYYWIQADCNGDYQSSLSTYSKGYAKTAVPTALAAPALKSASTGAYTDSVVLTWGEVPLAASYKVYRKINTADPWGASIADSITVLTYTDNSAAAGQRYLYAVTAVNGASESPKSAGKTGYAAGTAAPLADGVPTGNLSGGKGDEQLFSIVVPANCTRLVAKIENVEPVVTPLGSCDIYAKLGPTYPTTALYTAKGALIAGTKADKSLTVTKPAAGTWHILVYGSGTNGYTAANLTVTYHYATNIKLTQVPADDLAVPFTATFKGQLLDESNAGIPGFNIGVRDPVTGLQTWIATKTDANGLFTYSAAINGEGEYTYDFFLTAIPDNTRTIASWTVRTKRSPKETLSLFDFAGYIPATAVPLGIVGSPTELAGMQEFLSIRRGFTNGPADPDFSDMWVNSTIIKASTDANILAKLDAGLYLLLYGTEGAAAGNGKTLNPALTASPLLVHVAADKLDTVLWNLKQVQLIDNVLADNVAAGGIGVLAISSYCNPDETGVNLSYDVALFADEQLELLSLIAGVPDALQVSGSGKYSGNVETKQADLTLDSGMRIGTRITSFIKEYIPSP
ncbi:MAG: hypothetical protein A2X45_05185 [Lentisphaerae bacterium GWF2_50_93]|nr:MAG: hypothetical protein A2X45_05185 [Lentisphaerae bacterium GWF2_50_93]